MKKLTKRFVILICMLFLTAPVFAAQSESSQTLRKIVDKSTLLRAVEKYSDKIEAEPNSEDGYINRAYLNYLLGNIDAAIADYDKLISLNPKDEDFYLNRGYLNHISNKREKALQDYDMALKIKPDYAFAHNNRGVVLSELGRNEDSLASYNTAIKINPNYADAYYNRGNLKIKTDKDEEALADYNAAITLNPKDAASFNNRGVVKRKLNFNVGALSDFTIAIRLNPEDITAYANRGRLKKRYYDSEGAEEDFKSAIALAEQSPVIVKEMEVEAQIAANQKHTASLTAKESAEYQTAPAELNKALRQPAPTKDNLQKIAYKTETTATNAGSSNAVKASVVKVDPKNESAATASKLRQPVNTKPEITTKPVENPKLAECYYIRALQKYILQNRQSALADFNMAIQYNPQYAEAYYYRAAIKRDLKDEGFVDDYKKAIQINPELRTVADADVLTILKI